MNAKELALSLVLKYFDSFSIDSFYDRLMIQKIIYFVQKFDLNFSVNYNWYIRGPYSSTLTNMVYDIIPDSDINFENYNLKENITMKLDNVKKMIEHENKKESGLSNPEWMELLASLDYIYNSKVFGKVEDKNFECLIKRKPKYTKEQCKLAWEVLKEMDLVK